MPKQKRRRQQRPAQESSSRIVPVSGPADTATLASQLADPHRDHPILVITVAAGRTEPDVNMVRLADALPTNVAVRTITDGPDTSTLTDMLGDRSLAVYGGAARTYPAGNLWMSRLADASVRMLRQYPDRDTFTDAIIADCVQAAREPQRAARPATGPLPQLIDQPHLAAQLGRHLLDPGRDRTAVLVTRSSGMTHPLVDVDLVRSQVGDMVDVFEVANGPVGHALSDTLPDRASVYGGASRTYPPGWTGDVGRAPLRFLWHPEDADRVAEQVISDALRAVHAGGATSATPRAQRACTGRIVGVAGNRAIVALSGGGMAAIRPELTVDGVPAERLFAAGMLVNGAFDETAGRLDVTAMIRPAADALAGYRRGDIVWCRVDEVASSHADLTIYPGVTVRLQREHVIDPARPARIIDLLTTGETVAANLIEAGTAWRLNLTGVDPELVPLAAPSILPGGPEWLIPPPVETVEPEPVTEADPGTAAAPEPPAPQPVEHPDSAAVLPADNPALESMRAERDQLLRDLETQTRRSDRAERDLARARTRIREAETTLAQTRRKLGPAESAVDMIEREASLFADPEEQLRFEVQLAWARRIPAAEKQSRPLGRYSLGENFLTTLNDLEGVDRSKVVDVIVEVATGLVVELPGRELHQLRNGDPGNAPARVRADGATCWRVSLQVKSPSARRLHYWMLNDGSIELSSVRLHDDFRD